MLQAEDVRRVLEALGEEFLVDVPATHDGKGGYHLEFTTLANALCNADPEWVDRVTGYVNSKDYIDVGSVSPGGEPYRGEHPIVGGNAW